MVSVHTTGLDCRQALPVNKIASMPLFGIADWVVCIVRAVKACKEEPKANYHGTDKGTHPPVGSGAIQYNSGACTP